MNVFEALRVHKERTFIVMGLRKKKSNQTAIASDTKEEKQQLLRTGVPDIKDS